MIIDTCPRQVLFTDHLCFTGNAFSRALHMAFLRFGHVAVRYTTKVEEERTTKVTYTKEKKKREVGEPLK